MKFFVYFKYLENFFEIFLEEMLFLQRWLSGLTGDPL